MLQARFFGGSAPNGRPSRNRRQKQWQGKRRRSRPHVLFYGHYDVQPVDPLELWRRRSSRVVDRPADGRKIIVARGASDDKGQLMTFVEACRAWKRYGGAADRCHGAVRGRGGDRLEELPAVPRSEQGGAEGRFRARLRHRHVGPETPAITTALRGLVDEEVMIRARQPRSAFGPLRRCRAKSDPGADAHPRLSLRRERPHHHSRLLRRREGTAAGGPRAMAEAQLRRRRVPRRSGCRSRPARRGACCSSRSRSRPTCDVNGIVGGYTGEGAKTVIPAEASAKISFRLVGGQDPARIRKAFRDFVTRAGARPTARSIRRHRGRPQSRCRQEHEALPPRGAR